MGRDASEIVQPVQRGDTRTLLETDFANTLIRAVNRIGTADVSVISNGQSEVIMTDGNCRIVVSLAGAQVGGVLTGTLPNPAFRTIGTVTGSRDGNAAVESLIGLLVSAGLINDQSTT